MRVSRVSVAIVRVDCDSFILQKQVVCNICMLTISIIVETIKQNTHLIYLLFFCVQTKVMTVRRLGLRFKLRLSDEANLKKCV